MEKYKTPVVVKHYYDVCHSRTNQQFLDRRYGSLSKETKQEIYKLNMSMCLEQQYMKCMKHAKETTKKLANSSNHSIQEICEPLVEQYIMFKGPWTE